MTVFINLRAQCVGGGPAAEVRTLTSADDEPTTLYALQEWVRGKDVLLATHGFNVNQEDGIASLSHWQERMSLPANTVYIGVLWAGDAWLPVINYPFQHNDAEQSGKLLAEFLNRNFAEANSLAFASHSLGARMVLETLSRLDQPIRRLVLMAGAIDNTCLHKEYRHAADKVESISVLASRKDRVLGLAFPLGNFLGGIVSRGHPYVQEALGREGPVAKRANLRGGWQIPDEWKYGHGDYFSEERGTAMQPPVDIPAPGQSAPHDKAAWSAGFAATRIS